jgi:hypothetical protein
MHRLLLPVWVLALLILALACDDGDSPTDPPDGSDDQVNLAFFQGCWHIRSNADVFGEGPCRRALDSVVALFEVAGVESLFATVDTVTDLSFVPPYVGTGDYAGTVIPDRQGTVHAVFKHAAGACSLVTTLDGDITANGDTAFYAPYTLNIEFIGEDPCGDYGDCSASVLFQGTRRPDSRCTP